MTSRILSGRIVTKREPKQGNSYETLELGSDSKVCLEFEGTPSVRTYGGLQEITVDVKALELNSIRLPFDANPRKPEHLPVVEKIQTSAVSANPDLFGVKNNGLDVFAKSVEIWGNHLIIEFGDQDSRDGLCNGGLTYYALQRLPQPSDKAMIKLRLYPMDGADLQLKSSIAKAKNQNRSVSDSDDANFMGFFDRIKTELGELEHVVKWETGDVETSTETPITAGTMIRYLSALKIEDTYHWDLNPSAHPLTSHKKRTSLLTASNKYLDDFVREMRG